MRIIKSSLLVLVTICFSGAIYSQNVNDLNRLTTKYGQTLFYLSSYYLDTVNIEKMSDEAIKSIVSQLDPHSVYIPAKDVKSMNEPLEGNFDGVGIEFAIIKDTLTVASPIAGGPCEKVGIRAGDKIVMVDNEMIAGTNLTNERVYKYLRGTKGTRVHLGILRKGVSDRLDFEVVRDKIPINSLDAAYEVDPGVYYLKLSRFAQNSANEILEALVGLKAGKINGIILDLRGNSGGVLGTAMEISNFFLDAGQTIVYTEGLKSPKRVENANGTGFYKHGPLVVLIDENSASASEIVAGAMQDWDRGVIVGRRSFGKGLVQQMIPLNDGSQLRLTIARYHTPSGRVIQTPYKLGESDEYYKKFYKRYSSGELFNKDSINFPDSLKYKTLIKGRTVYGGGGIMPDYFMPADTSYYSEYYANLLRRGIITEFMNNLGDINRDSWRKQYKTFKSFEKKFVVDDNMIKSLVEYAAKKNITPDEKGLATSKNEITTLIKALAAKTIFNITAYYRVLNSESDETYSKALELIRSKALL
jgi:carboxyl-terminal processing protease